MMTDNSDEHPYQLNDFSLHETVGTGTFGRVRLVQSLLDLDWYVLKVRCRRQSILLLTLIYEPLIWVLNV